MIALLGRQPKIGIAELESIYSDVTPVGKQAAFVNNEINIARLGGTLKVAEQIDEFQSTDWRRISDLLIKNFLNYVATMPENGKIKLGISIYDINANSQQVFRTGLELKKIARKNGHSLRFIPGAGSALNSAQVLHNQLTSNLGIELCLIKDDYKTVVAKTVSVQDVDDYARRDFGRPKRDAFVGMLPPKLAQTMVNLAVGDQKNAKILDPFCGTGVVLQEALLAGFEVAGTDLSQKMIDYTAENLDWLKKSYEIKQMLGKLQVGDATKFEWRDFNFTNVVCETYLGQPLSGLPKPEKLREIIGNCNLITEKFLKNLRPQLKPGSRHCIAVPAWFDGKSFKHLPALDHLESLGYNRLRFQHSSNGELIYHRADQIVARELLVLSVKE
ncbi:MAG TPA: methyltransferase domain-containing protein [Candidatus Saccharimonadales bacterium]|nr:methyltransferase domain-containing protein [Candidatus Saccharimonadales bacterium]